jgi:hypothetical protein
MKAPPLFVVCSLPVLLTLCLPLKVMKIIDSKSIFVTNIIKTEVKHQTFLGQRYKLPGLCQYHLRVTVWIFFSSKCKNYTLHKALILPTVRLRYRNLIGKNCCLYALYVVHTPQRVLNFTASISNVCDTQVNLL